MESRSRLEGRKAARLQGRKDLYPATGISHGVGLVPALLGLYHVYAINTMQGSLRRSTAAAAPRRSAG